jgi:hypothetical protein
MSITRKQVIPLLREAAPGFEESWHKHLAWWGEKERGDFNDAGELAPYVFDSITSDKTSELPAVFAMIERILAEGDASAKELAYATVGATWTE